MTEPQADHKTNRKIVAALAFLGAMQPTPIPVAGVHKFYMGQYGWGIVYMLLGVTQVPRIASLAEGIWYLIEPQWQRYRDTLGAAVSPEGSPEGSPGGSTLGPTVAAVASGLREIEHLRQEGLLSEYEFEQKRRRLLEQMP